MTPRLLLLPLALCLVAPAAHATEPADQVVRASCGYDTAPWVEARVGDLSVGKRDEYHGVAYGYAVLSDPADRTRPVGGSVRCEIRRNGVPVASTPAAHGTTTIATAGAVTFSAAPADALSLCTVVDLDAGGTYESCGAETQQQIPPQELWDALDAVTDLVLQPVGAALCAVTGDDVVLDSPLPFSVATGWRSSEYGLGDDDLRYDCP